MVLLGAIAGVMLVAAWVFIESARAGSGNGGLLLLFVGPGAASIGAVIAATIWCFEISTLGIERR